MQNNNRDKMNVPTKHKSDNPLIKSYPITDLAKSGTGSKDIGFKLHTTQRVFLYCVIKLHQSNISSNQAPVIRDK